MSDRTKIEWADATVNAIDGCSVTSPGCTNCYAMKQAHRVDARRGLTVQSKGGMVWTGVTRFNEKALLQPLKWKRPRRIFWNAHGDTFHDSVPDEWIDRIFAVAALTPQHTHMILTKRSARMRRYVEDRAMTGAGILIAMGDLCDLSVNDRCIKLLGIDERTTMDKARPLPNVWLGVSVEDQARADERIPDLLATPAAVRFLSCEPLLGPVDLTAIPWPEHWPRCECLQGDPRYDALESSVYCPGCCEGPEAMDAPAVDWVIVGGESGPNARPMHPDWARSLRDQCADAGVPFHFKQWGEWAPICEMTEKLIDGCYHPAPERDPEASRRCKVDQCVLHADGERFDGRAMFELGAFLAGKRAMTMMKVGKRTAGRLLDGIEHNEMPEVQP
ncbi:phage Gp37/Gp68 family protein [Novosphingobium huizhouense]|uniref:phage Gp37/Gp68 family protein n=1 Tax=Novosphingobium huizhouense TaxID=2866625 RepID=UPI001CD90E29|nr:phage Gp37/Gp68 family protein [Novosphingobium huizhouense]